MTNINQFMNEYGSGRAGHIDKGHPLYMAGYMEGQKDERARAKELTLNLSVTSMDVFGEVLNLVHYLYENADEQIRNVAEVKLEGLLGAERDLKQFNIPERGRDM